jgi:hypothetical protein
VPPTQLFKRLCIEAYKNGGSKELQKNRTESPTALFEVATILNVHSGR